MTVMGEAELEAATETCAGEDGAEVTGKLVAAVDVGLGLATG